MKKEYDFSNAEQGKFFTEKVETPIYLDKDIFDFLQSKNSDKNIREIVNELLRKDIEIAKKVEL